MGWEGGEGVDTLFSVIGYSFDCVLLSWADIVLKTTAVCFRFGLGRFASPGVLSAAGWTVNG